MKFLFCLILIISSHIIISEENDGNKLVNIDYYSDFHLNNDTTNIFVKITPKKGWHSYWVNPGDAGLATSFQILNDYEIIEQKWETPKLFEFESLFNFGYSNEHYIYLKILKRNKLIDFNKIIIKANLLVCKEKCLPAEKIDTISLSYNSSKSDFNKYYKISINKFPLNIDDSKIRAVKEGNFIKIEFENGRFLPDFLQIFPKNEGIFIYKEIYPVKHYNGKASINLELSPLRVEEPKELGFVIFSENGFDKKKEIKSLEFNVLIK